MRNFLNRLRYGRQYGYEMLFKNQDPKPVGKTGVIVAEMGLPDEYEFEFYNHFMHHVFDYMLPFFIKGVVLADKGLGLIDPNNPIAREPFEPVELIDPYGSTTNKAGVPYIDCEFEWRPPGMKKNPWDHGYFLYHGDGNNGAADICDKVGAKIVGWYYGKLLPDKRVPWRTQHQALFKGARDQLLQRYPEVLFRSAFYMMPETLKSAVEELLEAGCETIVYQSTSCPVYTDFEDYAYALPLVHEYVAGRAKVIMADQLGCQPTMREAYLAILNDQLKEIPAEASVYVILSAHGHPFKKETQDVRAPLYRDPLEAGVRQIMAERGGRWDLTWSFDEYADEYWDPKNTKQETLTAYRHAIEEGFDYALELPTDFPAENTDLMIFHAMKKFIAFSDYDRDDPVHYTDWDKPLVRVFHEDKTTGIYAGCPVGPYQHFVVDALVSSLNDVLHLS